MAENQRIAGSTGLENSIHAAYEQARYDAAGKKLLSYKEVLATILKYSVPEYTDYSMEDIMGFIDMDTMEQNDLEEELARDTRLIDRNSELSSVGEARIMLDKFFRVLVPETVRVHLHIDLELQGDYYPGYSLIKRGIYNLSRLIDVQLDVINKETNYDKLEKVYSIFICVGNVPKYLWNTVSYYEFVNTRNIGTMDEHFHREQQKGDLMSLIMIRIGSETAEDASDIVRFLHGLFYNQKEEVEQSIDFSENERLRKDVESMGIGQGMIDYGRSLEREKTMEAEEKLEHCRRLYRCLLNDNRLDDLRKVIGSKDSDYEQKLMQEYGIE